MKIAVAQTRPVKGDIQKNIDAHKRFIRMAHSLQADLVVFPELSITGYEPALAKDLATTVHDERFDSFQLMSDEMSIIIAVGMPLKTEEGERISLFFFQPNQPRQVYSKQYLHEDEFPFFTAGEGSITLTIDKERIVPAICYEISVPEHAAAAAQNKATIYLASVAKTKEGVEKARTRLSAIAQHYSMTVLMSNCVGRCDNFIAAGHTSAWNNKGELVGRLDSRKEGVLLLNTVSGELTKQYITIK